MTTKEERAKTRETRLTELTRRHTKEERAKTREERLTELTERHERRTKAFEQVMLAIARVLGEAHEPMLPSQIARAVREPELFVKDALFAMVKANLVQKIGKRYATAGLDFPKMTRAKRAMARPRKGA